MMESSLTFVPSTSSINSSVSASMAAPLFKSSIFLKIRHIKLPNFRCSSVKLSLLFNSSVMLRHICESSLSKSFANRSMALFTNLSKWKRTFPIALRKVVSTSLPSSVSKYSTIRGIKLAEVGNPSEASAPAPKTTKGRVFWFARSDSGTN